MTTSREIQSRLASANVRMTPGRKAVVDVLMSASGPLTVLELQDAVAKRVPVSSLYRTLTVMEGADVVSALHGAGGLARFEISESLRGHHHHLVCTSCGAVIDVEVDTVEEDHLDRLAGGVASDVGFAVSGHSLEIEGVCRECVS